MRKKKSLKTDVGATNNRQETGAAGYTCQKLKVKFPNMKKNIDIDAKLDQKHLKRTRRKQAPLEHAPDDVGDTKISNDIKSDPCFPERILTEQGHQTKRCILQNNQKLQENEEILPNTKERVVAKQGNHDLPTKSENGQSPVKRPKLRHKLSRSSNIGVPKSCLNPDIESLPKESSQSKATKLSEPKQQSKYFSPPGVSFYQPGNNSEEEFESDIQTSRTSEKTPKSVHKRPNSSVGKTKSKDQRKTRPSRGRKKDSKELPTQSSKSHCQDDSKLDSEMGIENARDLLLRYESSLQASTSATNHSVVEEELMSDESESDWEEVADANISLEVQRSEHRPEAPVQITLQETSIHKKKRKKFDMQAMFLRQLNKFDKEVQENMHKVHLLCLLAHCLQRNRICNEKILQALAMSLVPHDLVTKCGRKIDLNLLQILTRWFNSTICIYPSPHDAKVTMLESLVKCFGTRVSSNICDLVCVFIVILRYLGANVRLIYSLQPVSHKVQAKVKDFDQWKRKAVKSSKRKNSQTGDKSTQENLKSRTRRKRKPKTISDVDSGSENERKPKPRRSGKRKDSKRKCDANEVTFVSSDSDFENDKERNRKILSSDSDSVEITKFEEKVNGRDFWLEVFSEVEQRWICIDCEKNVIDKPKHMEKEASQPVSYVVAVDNDGSIKDVTQRYASEWLSKTQKLRIDEKWWNYTLRPYRTNDLHKEMLENSILKDELMKKPLPTIIGQFKNHPLYALKRHLLKFQAIYPDTAVPVGYVRGEPVYAKECVRELHTRETWLKDARVVRIGEEPYKIVKGRRKQRDTSAEEPKAELFGLWQTEDFIPPIAQNGKVPKNQYGNVELFKPCMLPKGTVHLPLDGVHKVCKKLSIDYAPAMMGWEQHGGFAHPIIEGVVVCEEFAEVLTAAWEEEQAILDQKEADKREKRVLENWRKLVRGLFIREKLKNKYNFNVGNSKLKK